MLLLMLFCSYALLLMGRMWQGSRNGASRLGAINKERASRVVARVRESRRRVTPVMSIRWTLEISKKDHESPLYCADPSCFKGRGFSTALSIRRSVEKCAFVLAVKFRHLVGCHPSILSEVRYRSEIRSTSDVSSCFSVVRGRKEGTQKSRVRHMRLPCRSSTTDLHNGPWFAARFGTRCGSGRIRKTLRNTDSEFRFDNTKHQAN
jgi:hypothetical protein